MLAASWNLDEPLVPEDSVRVSVVFVRHGESEWNAEGRIQGHLGGGLTDRGRVQARAAAAHLWRTRPRPSLVVSSDLPRSVETAQAYVEQCALKGDIRLDRRLREVDNGSWGGRLAVEVAAAEAEYITRIRNGEDLTRGGGESLADAQQRVRDFSDSLATELASRADPADRRALVFGHGGTIRLAALAALGLSGTAAQLLGHAANTAITEIEYWVHHDGAVLASRLLEYNSAQHVAVRLGETNHQTTPAPVN